MFCLYKVNIQIKIYEYSNSFLYPCSGINLGTISKKYPDNISLIRSRS